MSQYLRDESLKCITVPAESLRKINEDLNEIAKAVVDKLPENERANHQLIPIYVIRFDGKGFRLHDFEQVMRYFTDANVVERLAIAFQSPNNIAQANFAGKRIEIHLDTKNPENCSLLVEDDDRDWVDFVFMKIRERLLRYSNRNWIVRSQGAGVVIQLLGVGVGFLFSIWASIIISPALRIENAMLFSFIAAFLLFSNMWTFMLNGIGKIADTIWPNVSFRKPSGLHWLVQGLIATAAFSLITVLFLKLFAYLGSIFKPLLN